MVPRPAAGEDLDLLLKLGGVDDVEKGTVGEIIKGRGMRLVGDGFI